MLLHSTYGTCTANVKYGNSQLTGETKAAVSVRLISIIFVNIKSIRNCTPFPSVWTVHPAAIKAQCPLKKQRFGVFPSAAL